MRRTLFRLRISWYVTFVECKQLMKQSLCPIAPAFSPLPAFGWLAIINSKHRFFFFFLSFLALFCFTKQNPTATLSCYHIMSWISIIVSDSLVLNRLRAFPCPILQSFKPLATKVTTRVSFQMSHCPSSLFQFFPQRGFLTNSLCHVGLNCWFFPSLEETQPTRPPEIFFSRFKAVCSSPTTAGAICFQVHKFQ